jgi:erythromycin esterase
VTRLLPRPLTACAARVPAANRTPITTLSLLLPIFCSSVAHADTGTLNLDFEQAQFGSVEPTLWRTVGEGYSFQLDPVQPRSGRYSLRIERTSSGNAAANSFGAARLALPATEFRGKTLHFGGCIRTAGAADGASLVVYVNGPDGGLQRDTMEDRAPRGTTPWRRYDIELAVDAKATRVVMAVVLTGNGTAWFDSLELAADGRPVEPPPAAPAPRADPGDRLLENAELAIEPDPAAAPEDSGRVAWMQYHALPIRSLVSADFSDLRRLRSLLAGKRIVALGESAHEVAQFSLVKTRLIRFLHEELGFDVLAFEGSLYECYRANELVGGMAPIDVLLATGVWPQHELLPLFEYIEKTHRTLAPLRIAGVDIHPTSRRCTTRPAFFRDLIEPVDHSYARTVYEMDSTTVGGAATIGQLLYAWKKRAADDPEMGRFYRQLAAFLRDHEAEVRRAWSGAPDAPRVGGQVAWCLAQLADASRQSYFAVRDSSMALNCDFLVNELYPGKKIILWAHNVHIRRDNAAVSSDGPSMGTWISRRYGPAYYCLGLYMYRGTLRTEGRVVDLLSPTPGGLESILYRGGLRYSFVDLSRAAHRRDAEHHRGAEWMFEPLVAESWGGIDRDEKLVPTDQYDGIVFIETVGPATPIERR